MKLDNVVPNLREAVMKNFEMCPKIKPEGVGPEMIIFMTVERDWPIFGGLADRYDNTYFGITTSGWTFCGIESEHGQKPNGYPHHKVENPRVVQWTDSQMIEYLNGEDCSIGSAEQFIAKAKEISQKFGFMV